MRKRILTIEESKELYERELEGMLAAAEGSTEIAAYWWTRITRLKAEAKGNVVVAEITPEQVEQLLRNYFEQDFDEDDIDVIAAYLGLMCPSKVEVLFDDDGEWKGFCVIEEEEEEEEHDSLEDCE